MNVAVASALWVSLAVQEQERAELGKVCPDLTVKSLEGKEVKLADLRGRVTLVVFWSFRCKSGKQIIGRINEAASELEKNGVTLIAACPYGETAEELKQYSADKGIKHALYCDPDAYAAAKLFRCKTITSSYLLDKQGKLVYVGNIVAKPGEKTYDGIQAALDLAAGKELKRNQVKQGGDKIDLNF